MKSKTQHLEALMDAYGDYLKRTAFMLTGDSHLAEDLTQETFISYYKHLDQFKGEATHKTYLYRILMNHIKMHARKHKNAPSSLEIGGHISFENDLIATMDLQHALSKMKTDHQMVIWLHYYEDLSVAEIAKVLSITQSGVKMRLKRARESLKEILSQNKTLHFEKGGTAYETHS